MFFYFFALGIRFLDFFLYGMFVACVVTNVAVF